jgi:hypothetical protein
MTDTSASTFSIHFLDATGGAAGGRLADVELHFSGGLLDGLRLMGFAVWQRRGGDGLNVTFPARQYVVNGERRSFALLRPVTSPTAQDLIRAAILDAWRASEFAEAV